MYGKLDNQTTANIPFVNVHTSFNVVSDSINADMISLERGKCI